MKTILGTATTGLPALVGVLLGIRSFTSASATMWLLGDLALIVAGLAFLGTGIALLPKHPAFGRWLIEIWIICAVGVMALATFALLWISLEPLPRFLGTVVGDERVKSVTSAFSGAIAAYIALVWTKDIADGTGLFWPSTQFRQGLAAAWPKMNPKPQTGSKARAAMFDDYVEGIGEIGWDFADRSIRAGIIQDFVKTSQPAP